MSTSRVVRVASVPADHPYVEHLAAPDSGATSGPEPTVVRLADPPVVADDGSVRWWPPRLLDPVELAARAGEFDVLHVHFGFESFSPAQLQDVVATLDGMQVPLVVTVHDLRNPHVPEAAHQLERLDVLVPAAAAVITLTDGAAEEIRRRWGRRAHVLPHPHVVPLETLPEQPTTGEVPARPRIGLHLKSLRRNVDALGALRGLELVARGGDVDVVVTLHRAVTDPTDRGYDADVVSLVRRLETEGLVTLVVHEPMDDDTLYAHVGGLDISVMANVWGTHSGWIEMCHDLGVRVVAPEVGFYREQHDPVPYALDSDAERIEPAALAEAVRRAVALPRPPAAGRAEREDERRTLAEAHEAIYRSALNDVSVHSTSPSTANERSQPSMGQTPHRSR